MVLGIAIPLALQVLDKRRMPVASRERAWNAASWGAALYGFGPLSMLGWVWVTRARFRDWRRDGAVVAIGKAMLVLLVGVAAVAVVGVVILAADYGLARLSGEPG
jgi:hypothetical protein